MSTDVQKLWGAFSILGDHFSRLGGAARYRNMPESDIPLYIGCQLAASISPAFDRSQYISPAFLESAKPVLAEVNATIAEIQQPPDTFATLLAEFVSYAEQKVKGSDRAESWCRFVEWGWAPHPQQFAAGPAPLTGRALSSNVHPH